MRTFVKSDIPNRVLVRVIGLSLPKSKETRRGAEDSTQLIASAEEPSLISAPTPTACSSGRKGSDILF